MDTYDLIELALFLIIVYFVFAFFFSLLQLVMELSIQCFNDITKCLIRPHNPQNLFIS